MIGKYGLQSPYQDSIKNILVYASNNNQVINNTLIIESKVKKKWQSLNTIPLKRYGFPCLEKIPLEQIPVI